MDPVEVEVRPRSPFRLPRLTGGDRLIRSAGNGFERLLVVDRAPVVARVRAVSAGSFRFSAWPADTGSVEGPGSGRLIEADHGRLLEAIDQMRFATGIDLDLSPMREQFTDDPLLGPVITPVNPSRPQRRPQPWEALLWAITEQLIEYRRAVGIQKRMIRKWGMKLRAATPAGLRGIDDGCLRTVPTPEAIAAASPAELQGCGLSARRAIAMIKVAGEVTSGRCDLRSGQDDRRLLAIPEIGPWTIACLGLRGRGDPDALLAGDLAQVKLVGYLERLGRNAEIEEVEAFYARYAPWRGLAGEFLLSAHGAPLHGPGNTARIRRGHRGLPRVA